MIFSCFHDCVSFDSLPEELDVTSKLNINQCTLGIVFCLAVIKKIYIYSQQQQQKARPRLYIRITVLFVVLVCCFKLDLWSGWRGSFCSVILSTCEFAASLWNKIPFLLSSIIGKKNCFANLLKLKAKEISIRA